MDDVKVIFLDMPASIKAYTIAKDCYYTIVLNSNLSQEVNRKSYLHELDHINNGDFDKNCNVNILEIFSHERR